MASTTQGRFDNTQLAERLRRVGTEVIERYNHERIEVLARSGLRYRIGHMDDRATSYTQVHNRRGRSVHGPADGLAHRSDKI